MTWVDGAVVSYETDSATGPTASYVIPRPTAGGALVAGQVLIASISWDTPDTTVITRTLPSGWTSILGGVQVAGNTTTTTVQFDALIHTVTADEAATPPAGWTVTMTSGSYDGAIAVERHTDVDADTLSSVAIYKQNATTGTVNPKTAPAVTTTAADATLVTGAGLRSGSSTLSSITTGYSVGANAFGIGGRGTGLAHKTQPDAGLSTAVDWSFSGTSYGYAWQVALPKAAATSAPTVSAGADASVSTGATFSRLATENGNGSTITARKWEVVSGPSGAVASIGTAAELAYTPTVAGTYVLRYSATNAVGTGSDDVTLTVTGVASTRVVAWRMASSAADTPADSAATAGAIIVGSGARATIPFAESTVYEPNKVAQVFPTSATATIAAAISGNQFVGFPVSRTGNLTPKSVRLKIAAGGTSGPRGFAVRTSLDNYGSDLYSRIDDPALPENTRPNLVPITLDLSSFPAVANMQLRVYFWNSNTLRSYELDDVEIEYAEGGTVSDTPGPVSGVSPVCLDLWTGWPMIDGGRVTATVDANCVSARLKVGTNEAVTTGVVYGPAVTPDSQGNVKATVTGLPTASLGTQYYGKLAMTNREGSEWLDTLTFKFKTKPTGRAPFTFTFGSCWTGTTTDSAAVGAMADYTDDAAFIIGDLYYADDSGTDEGNFRAKFNSKKRTTNGARLLASRPVGFTPSDHDGMQNDSSNATNSGAWTNFNKVYREEVAHPTLTGGTRGVYWSDNWGTAVRIVVLDTRSFAASGTVLGATQKAWFKNLIDTFAEELMVIVQDHLWIHAAEAGDGWPGAISERNELGDYIAARRAAGKAFVMLGGDQHCLAYDNGTNSRGGFPVYHAAPLRRDQSRKGGPYSGGQYPSSGSGEIQQYGRVQITLGTNQIISKFTGYDSSKTVRLNPAANTFTSTPQAEPEPVTLAKLYVGDKAVTDVFLGDTAVSAVYVGNTQVFTRSTLPDLRVTPPGVVGDNNVVNVRAGDVVKFNGNWAVDNAPVSTNVLIRWYVDDVQVADVTYGPSGVGGYGAESAGTWTATAGAHVLKMTVDPLGNIDEAHEGNNTATRPFTVASTTPSVPAGVPASATLTWAGDFETGDATQWSLLQCKNYNGAPSAWNDAYPLTFVGNGAQRQGNYAARFEVRDGDVPPFGGGERSELSAENNPAAGLATGEDKYWAFSLKFDSTFTSSDIGSFFIPWQLHSGVSGTSPRVCLMVSTAGVLQLSDNTTNTRWPIGDIAKGTWVDYVIRVVGSTGSNGIVQAWRNGVEVVTPKTRQTMEDASSYLKAGIYRSGAQTSTSIVFHDGMRVYKV